MADNANKFTGKDFLVQLLDPGGGGGYITIAGLRATSWSFGATAFDVTDKDNMPWDQMIAGGIAKISISLGGVFKDAAVLQYLNWKILTTPAGVIVALKLISGNGDVLQGNFFIKTLARSGPHTAEETYTMSIEGAGDITYTAPAPTVATISPPTGSTFNTAGGQTGTIKGTKIMAGATLTIEGTPVALTIVDGQTATFVAPAKSAASYPVVLTNPDSQSAAPVNITYA